MKELRIHAGLFVAAAVAAFLTWNRDTVSEADRGLFLAWDRDTTDVASVRYQSPVMDLLIERRTDADGDFLWATESGAQHPDALEYPVGAPGHTLVGRLASLRVVRDLGELSPERMARYGLTDAEVRITVRFADELRELVVGDSVFGGGDRYAAERATGVGYVIPRDIVNPMRIGEGAIRERWLHHFQDADVATVRVLAGAGGETRTMTRGESGEWTGPGSTEPDAGFANLMDRVGQLAIAGYGVDPASLGNPVPLLRVDYMDAEGSFLGFVELLRDLAAERDPYYIRSERTRVVAEAVTTLAERVEQGLGEAF